MDRMHKEEMRKRKIRTPEERRKWERKGRIGIRVSRPRKRELVRIRMK